MTVSRVDATARQREKRGVAAQLEGRCAPDSLALQMLANVENLATDTAATVDGIRKIMRTRLAIAEGQIGELRERIAALEAGRHQENGTMPDYSHGSTFAERARALLAEHKEPEHISEQLLQLAHAAGARRANELIDALIAACDANKDPIAMLSIVAESNNEMSAELFAKTRAWGCDHIVTAAMQAKARGYRAVGKQRRTEISIAWDGLLTRLKRSGATSRRGDDE